MQLEGQVFREPMTLALCHNGGNINGKDYGVTSNSTESTEKRKR